MHGGRRDSTGGIDSLRNDSNGTATTLASGAAETLGGLRGRSRISPRPKQDPVFWVLLLPIAGLAGQLATYAVHAMLFKTPTLCTFRRDAACKDSFLRSRPDAVLLHIPYQTFEHAHESCLH